ncbi:MAG: SdpI family protein [Cytophagaceae bacterium]|nr:MAG: SdpI family protein [Cytophagaceae bacterium]
MAKWNKKISVKRIALMELILPAIIAPLIILICGLIFKKYPPKKINYLYGYRSSRSMLNDDTWVTANQLAARSLVISQAAIFVLSVLVFFLEKYQILNLFDTLTDIYPASMILSTVFALLPVFHVEYMLKKLFHEDGSRKKNQQ